jgi:putative ABC transport system permease protein
VRGRTFNSGDRRDTQKTAVVNEAFVEKYGSSVVDQALEIGGDRGVQIVGVVRDIPYSGDDPLRPIVYLPAEQANTGMFNLTLVVRAAPTTEDAVIETLQRRMADEFPGIVAPTFRTYDGMVASQTQEQEFTSRLALWIGAVELALGSIGLYGLLLFSLAARTREVGVRLALGARPMRASWAVIRSGLRYALAGGGIGILAGVPIVLIVSAEMLGARAADPVPYIGAVLCVLTAAVLATCIPALRAARVQPAIALRHE